MTKNDLMVQQAEREVDKLRGYFLKEKFFTEEMLKNSDLWRAIRYRPSMSSAPADAEIFNFEYKYPKPCFDKTPKTFNIKPGVAWISSGTVSDTENDALGELSAPLCAYCAGMEFLRATDEKLFIVLEYYYLHWEKETRCMTIRQTSKRAQIDLIPGRRAKQVAAIVAVAEEIFGSAQSIPFGGKSKLAALCKQRYNTLFLMPDNPGSNEPFTKAWKDGNTEGLICIADKERFKEKS